MHVNTSIMAEDSGLKLDEKGCVLQDVIVVCGGVSRTLLGPGSRTVFVYLLRENRWVQLPDLPYPVMRAVVAVDWDSRVLVVNCICRDEELQLLSCCPYMMEWTTTKVIAVISLDPRAVCVCVCYLCVRLLHLTFLLNRGINAPFSQSPLPTCPMC